MFSSSATYFNAHLNPEPLRNFAFCPPPPPLIQRPPRPTSHPPLSSTSSSPLVCWHFPPPTRPARVLSRFSQRLLSSPARASFPFSQFVPPYHLPALMRLASSFDQRTNEHQAFSRKYTNSSPLAARED